MTALAHAAASPRACRGLAVIGATGGAGVSMLAAAVALAWARGGETVWLADMDLMRGDIAAGWDLPAERTLHDLVPVAGELRAEHLRRAAVRHDSGVWVLPAPGTVDGAMPWDLPTGAALCAALRAEGDAVMDLGAGGALTGAAVAAATAVLVVCPSTLAAVRRAGRLIDRWRATEVEARVAVARTRGSGRAEVGARAMARALGTNVVADLPWSPREARLLAAGTWPPRRRAGLAHAVDRLAEALP